MGALFSQKCDLCPKVQTEENHANIKGVSFMMNGTTKFCCLECKEMLDGAFSVGAEGLRDPLKALAAMTKERDQLLRMLQQAGMQKETGNATLAGVEVDHLRAQRYNELGMDKRFQPAGLGFGEIKAPATTKKLGYKESKSKKK
jgi:hypothetical protein